MANTKRKISAAGIKAAIATFTTNRDKLRQLAQDIIVMVALHSAPKFLDDEANGTGDCTGMLALTRVMPKSWAAQAETHIAKFTPIVVNTGNDKVGFSNDYKKLETDEERKNAWDLAGLRMNNFWDIEEPDVQKEPLDFAALVKLVRNLGSTMRKRVENGEVANDDQTTAIALAEQLETMRITRVKTPAIVEAAGETGTSDDGVEDEDEAVVEAAAA